MHPGRGRRLGTRDSDHLTRIGVAPLRSTADLATVRAIVAGHTRSTAFQNLNPFTGREVDLDPDALTAKLVHGGRGGYCFEHNLPLRSALDGLGHRTMVLTGRVAWGRPDDAPPLPRTHVPLRIDLAEGPHLVDVGFGGRAPPGSSRWSRTGSRPRRTSRPRDGAGRGVVDRGPGPTAP